MSAEEVRIDKVLRRVIKQPVNVLDGIVSRLGGDLANMFRTSLENAYFDDTFERPMAWPTSP